MKRFQNKWWITTIGKKIIRQPLGAAIDYERLAEAVSQDTTPIKRPNTYYRDQIASIVERIEQVLQGEYTKSGRSKTSAFTTWAHTHFWEDPDIIHSTWRHTAVNTKWLLSISSQWYINNEYNIEALVTAKDELINLLQQTQEA